MDSRWKKGLAGTLALVLCVALIARAVRDLARSPLRNWDMLPAMALALEWEERDPVELHRRTYALAREELPPEVFRELTAPGVRQVRAQDPAAFHEHLPFYRARVLYSLSVLACYRLGVPLSDATQRVSLVSYVILALLFFAWTMRHLPLVLAGPVATGLAFMPALLNQARLSSADALATLFVCLAAEAYLERRSYFLTAFAFVAAVAARPDSVILCACFLVTLALLAPPRERPPLLGLGAWLAFSVALVLALSAHAGEYGWWPLIQISFVEKAVHPAALPTAVDWTQYGEILARQLAALPGVGYTTTPAGEVTGSSLVFPCAALALLGMTLARRRGDHATLAFLAALLVAYTARYFLFPQAWDRFYAPFYALVPLCVLRSIARNVSVESSDSALARD